MDTTSTSTVKITYSSPDDRLIKRALIQLLEYATGRSILEKKLNKILESKPSERTIWSKMLQELNITLDLDCKRLYQLPKSGPLILVANHPFGVVDGIAMAHIASTIRPHFKALVNEVLCREQTINSCFLPVDFRDTKEAMEVNIRSRKKAIEYLHSGGTIVIFPAGGVSTSPGIFQKAEDFEWKRFVVKLIEKTDATVVPIYFAGQNSILFQLASLINMNLRYGLLLNEVKNKMGKSIKVAIGEPIDKEIHCGINRNEILPYLRDKVYSLQYVSI